MAEVGCAQRRSRVVVRLGAGLDAGSIVDGSKSTRRSSLTDEWIESNVSRDNGAVDYFGVEAATSGVALIRCLLNKAFVNEAAVIPKRADKVIVLEVKVAVNPGDVTPVITIKEAAPIPQFVDKPIRQCCDRAH